MAQLGPLLLPSWTTGLVAAAVFAGAGGCVSQTTHRALDRGYDASLRASRSPAPEASSAAEPDLSRELDRDTLVELAVARSPVVTLGAHRARALVHAGRAQGALPSPELMFEAQNLPLARPYALGEAEMYMLELRQRFPAAGSLDARARAMAEEAQVVLAELLAEQRLVAEQADQTFTRYERAVAEQRLQAQQLEALAQMAQAVAARYSTGGARLAEAARIDVEISRVQRSLARLDAEIQRTRAGLNALLRRPALAPLGEPKRGAAQTVALSLDQLFALARKHRGPTLAADARLRAAGARREVAEAEAELPEVLLGVGYWQVPEMRPGVGVTAAMSLPWLWGPGRHDVARAAAEEDAERASLAGAALDEQAEVSQAHARLLGLERELAIVQGRALPAARRSLEALTAAFTTGSASLLEWVDTARSLLDLELETVELRGELALAVAALERSVGAPLPRVPLPVEASP